MQSESGCDGSLAVAWFGFFFRCEDAQGHLAVPTDTPLHPPYTALRLAESTL